MGLERADQPLVGQGAHGAQKRLHLVGMVGVVVVHLCAVVDALMLEPASRAGEGGETLLHGLAVHPQQVGGGGGGQRIGYVVLAGNVQRHMGVALSPDDHIECAEPVEKCHIVGAAVGAVILDAVGENGAIQPLHGGAGALIVQIDHDPAGTGGYQLGKLVEGVLNVRQILEEVQMVGVYVEDHRHGGEEIQKGVAVFAGLQNDGVALSHPVAGVEQRQRAADHNGGILLRRHEDMGGHGRGGGLAVGTGHAQGVAVALHDAAPRLRPLVYGDAPCDGPGDLRIAVVNGSGADHRIAVFQVFGGVADGHLDPHGAQVPHRVALRHIRPLHHKAHAL